MVFIDNFVHADLHPGNVLVREVPGQEEKYTIVFVDAGIAMSLNPNDQQNLLDLFKAVVLNDGYNAGALMVERARYERCSSIPGGKHAFASGIAEIVSEFHDRSKQGLTLGAVRVGSLLGRVLDLCRRYGVEIDPSMASVIVSMLVLEGLGRSLDPDLNLMKAAMPFILGRGKV
jgi:aarF domain-containing kinase